MHAAGVLAGLALGLALATTPRAEAGFRVSPTVIDVATKPGRAVAGTFDVGLEGERGNRFEVEVQDAVQQPDGSFAYVPASGSPFSSSTWVALEPRAFAGGPDRTQPVQYTVSPPESAEPGDHVTALVVQRFARGASEQTVQPVQAVAVRLTVTIRGRAVRDAEIVDFDAPAVAGGSPLRVSALVRNTGNVRVDFEREPGSLAILDGEQEEAALDFEGALYPGQQRLFELDWEDAPLIGQFRARATIDAGAESVEESKSVVVFPWRQLGALVLLALAAVVLVAGLGRRRR